MSIDNIFLKFIERYDSDTKKIRDEIHVSENKISLDILEIKNKIDDVASILKHTDVVNKVKKNEDHINEILVVLSNDIVRREEQKLNERLLHSEQEIEVIKLKYMSKKSLNWLIGIFTSVFSGILLYIATKIILNK